MGGPVQAEEGILGAIVGSNQNDFEEAKSILLNFCKEVIYFGKIGMGAKTKLLSNFLSLGTATFVAIAPVTPEQSAPIIAATPSDTSFSAAD